MTRRAAIITGCRTPFGSWTTYNLPFDGRLLEVVEAGSVTRPTTGCVSPRGTTPDGIPLEIAICAADQGILYRISHVYVEQLTSPFVIRGELWDVGSELTFALRMTVGTTRYVARGTHPDPSANSQIPCFFTGLDNVTCP